MKVHQKYQNTGFLGTFISMMGQKFYGYTFKTTNFPFIIYEQFFNRMRRSMRKEEVLINNLLSRLFNEMVRLDGGENDTSLTIPLTEIPALLMPIQLKNVQSRMYSSSQYTVKFVKLSGQYCFFQISCKSTVSLHIFKSPKCHKMSYTI